MDIHCHYAIGAWDGPSDHRKGGSFYYISGLPINFSKTPLATVEKLSAKDCIALTNDPDSALLFAWRSFFWSEVFDTYELGSDYRLVPLDEKTGKFLTKKSVSYRTLYNASMVKLHGKDGAKRFMKRR